jgi:hypothetical protein
VGSRELREDEHLTAARATCFERRHDGEACEREADLGTARAHEATAIEEADRRDDRGTIERGGRREGATRGGRAVASEGVEGGEDERMGSHAPEPMFSTERDRLFGDDFAFCLVFQPPKPLND